MVWNVLNNSHVKANDVTLPNMSVKPYIQYGIGLQKKVKEHFTAYGQAMIQNGGRNGISLTAGFRWAIGKDKKPVEKVRNDKEILKQAKNTKKEIIVSDKTVLRSAENNKTTVVKVQSPQKVGKIREFFAKMDGEPIGQSTITPRNAIISKI